MRKLSLSILTLFFIFTGTHLKAQERLEMEGTQIIGNKELPKILYIVPWKSAEPFVIASPPIVSIMDKKLTPIDRASFKRKINYHNAIFSKAERTDPVTE